MPAAAGVAAVCVTGPPVGAGSLTDEEQPVVVTMERSVAARIIEGRSSSASVLDAVVVAGAPDRPIGIARRVVRFELRAEPALGLHVPARLAERRVEGHDDVGPLAVTAREAV